MAVSGWEINTNAGYYAAFDGSFCRECWSKQSDKFIVGFVGSFDKRKGILRLEKAVDKLDDVYFICAGKGDLVPTSKKCLFANTVNNDKLIQTV